MNLKFTDHVTKESSKEEPTEGVRICSAEERLATINSYCEANAPYKNYKGNTPVKLPGSVFTNKSKGSNSVPRDLLDRVSDEDILKLSHELWLDPENQVIVCMHAKAGCSTWKALLANNTGKDPMPSKIRNSIHAEIFKRGMKCADEGKDPEVIRHRLRTWYKFVIVRHPFDR